MEFNGELESVMRQMGIKFGLFTFHERSKTLKAFLTGLPEISSRLVQRIPYRVHRLDRAFR
jgi:hypothetical protein